MAHNLTENEETEFNVLPETITLLCCINCTTSRVSNTNNTLCHKCFSSSSSNKSIVTRSIPSTNPLPDQTNSNSTSVESVVSVKRQVNRCSGCRKKVGLTGFRCRCGDLFCSQHRYSDRHDCSYDYKSVGREMIAKENPLVKAAKILRI